MLLDRLAFGRLMAGSIGDTHIHWDSNWRRDNEESVKAECSLSDAEVWALQALDWKVELPETAGAGHYFGGINAIEVGADGTYTGYADPRRTNAVARMRWIRSTVDPAGGEALRFWRGAAHQDLARVPDRFQPVWRATVAVEDEAAAVKRPRTAPAGVPSPDQEGRHRQLTVGIEGQAQQIAAVEKEKRGGQYQGQQGESGRQQPPGDAAERRLRPFLARGERQEPRRQADRQKTHAGDRPQQPLAARVVEHERDGTRRRGRREHTRG